MMEAANMEEKIEIVDSFSDNKYQYRVIDERDPTCKIKISRKLILDGVKGCYSAVPYYTDELIIYRYCSKIIKAQSRLGMDQVLVLGGGGCSLPIYIVKNYKNSQLTVLEISPELCEAAGKHFFNIFLDEQENKRIKLINKDAFSWLDDSGDCKFHFIFVDIFLGADPESNIFENKFITVLKNKLMKNGSFVFNLGNTNKKNAVDLLDKVKSVIPYSNILFDEGQTVLFGNSSFENYLVINEKFQCI